MKLRLVFGALLFSVCGTLRAADKPNVVFVLCDDLGIMDLHCYGRADHHTPNLDQLARQGMRFTSAYCAQAICSPSRAAILTGKTPARLHLTTFLPGRPDCDAQKVLHPEIEMQVPLSEKILPNYFHDAGYATAAIGKWHVGGKGFGPVEHGFDVYHEGHANTKPSATEGGKGEYDLTNFAIQFIEQHKDRPFFVYLAHNAPHIPYDAQPARIANNKGAFEPVYAGVIETIDDTVGRLLAKLDELKLADNTIVVFTSDNGGLHVPEGPHPRVTYNTPYRAGKGFDYEGGLRIPLIVRWPGHVPAGVVNDSMVINTDWLPTLLELTGQRVPSGLDGVSDAPLLTGHGPAPARTFFWHFPHYTNQGSRPSGAERDGRWFYVEYYDADQVELYDLAADISQSHNVADQQPEQVTKMRAALAAWRTQVNAQTNRPNPNFDENKYKALYQDVDASRFDPLHADQTQWETIWQWRKLMNAAVAPAAKPKPAAAVKPAAKAGPDFGRAAQLLQQAVEKKIFPGCAVAVGNHERVLWTQGFGRLDYEGGPEATPTTFYDLASLTKIVGTTSVVVTLVRDGKLVLTDPVSRYVPEFLTAAKDDTDRARRQHVTLEHLLTHSAGFPGWLPLYNSAHTYDEMLKAVIATPLEADPGKRTAYSDLGAMLLGEAAARAGGKRLADLEQERVFEPLHLHDTLRNPPESLLPRIAPTERKPAGQGYWRGIVHDENARAGEGLTGHAGLFSTAADMAIWSAEWLKGARGQSQIFPQKLVATFTRRRELVKGSNRALGWETPSPGNTAGKKLSAHSFGHTGFTGTSVWIDPDADVYVVLLTNAVHPRRGDLRIQQVRRDLADAVIDALHAH